MAEEREVSELMKEFVHALTTFVKQRGAEMFSAIVVDPLKKMAGKIGLGCAGITFVSLGIVFLGMFMVHGFARLFNDDYVYGYLCSTFLMLILGAILLWAMSRGGKEEEAKRDDKSGDRTKDHR